MVLDRIHDILRFKNPSSPFAARTEEGSSPFITRRLLPFGSAAHAEGRWKLMIPTSDDWCLLIVILSSLSKCSVENLGG